VAADDEPGLGEPDHDLSGMPRYLWRVVRTAVDYLALNTHPGRELASRARPYPDPFVQSHLLGHAGAELGCWVGMRERAEPVPMIVFVPGTFATKDAANTRDKVLGLREATQAHLCALDLRGFGHSSDLHSTGGYLEALDLARVAAGFQGDDRVSHVLLAGESLGAAASLVAARHAPDDVDGVLAVNPFADLDWVIRHLTAQPPRWGAGRVVHHAFEVLLRHVSSTARGFDDYLARMAEIAGLSVPQLTYRASPRFHVGRLRSPALVLHATDDPVIPAFHAHVLREAAEGNDEVRVHLTRGGGHASFDAWDEDWYWGTVEGFVDEVVGS
jgi:pimeloyl-ACP methyl ester carboxylesterase